MKSIYIPKPMIGLMFTVFFTFTIWYSFIRDNPLTSVIDLPPTYMCEHDPLADVYLCTSPDRL